MKIAHFNAVNVLGISALTITPQQPIVLVAGDNGAGKTSVYQAIRLALFDELPRVELKRDAGELVRMGAGKGQIAVSLVNGNAHNHAVTLPDRKRALRIEPLIVARCLDPHAFALLEPSERIKFVLQISNVSMTTDAIAQRLAARGIDAAIVAEVKPLLVLGFEKCEAHAKEQAAQHRGAWRALTGENYGSKKAENWKRPGTPPPVPEAPASMDDAIKGHTGAVQALETLRAKRRTLQEVAAQRARDTGLAESVNVLTAKVAELQPLASADEERAHLACPECGAVLDYTPDTAGGKLVSFKPDPDRQVVKPSVRAKAKADFEAAQRQLSAALAARARLDELDERPPEVAPTDEEFSAAEQKVAEAADLMRSVTTAQQAYAAAVSAHKAHVDVETQANAEHRLVQAWEHAETALAPQGIPSELMNAAMTPMREAIKMACASASVATWPLPDVAEDGSIAAWGRQYGLLSESEQYRVDIVLAAAFAILTGVRCIAMDRADVLSQRVRSELLNWLMDLVDSERLDQAWVFVTLKVAPTVEPPVEVHWIENGAEAQAA
jgi:hypothetical protein